jgi:hypothetical protein
VKRRAFLAAACAAVLPAPAAALEAPTWCGIKVLPAAPINVQWAQRIREDLRHAIALQQGGSGANLLAQGVTVIELGFWNTPGGVGRRGGSRERESHFPPILAGKS